MSAGQVCRRTARILVFWGCAGLLTACAGLSGVWTGANLLYDRHSWYKKFDDFQLRATAARLLYHDKQLKPALRAVEVAAFNGDLLVAGHVALRRERDGLYARIQASHLTYRRLFRYVTVASSEANQFLDAWITSQIISQALLDVTIDPHAFKVVTVDQVVYLMGDMLPYQAKQLIAVARNTSDVRYVVKLLKYYHLTDEI